MILFRGLLNVTNKNASSSAYLIDSSDLGHARLGHFSLSYIKKIHYGGLIDNVNFSCTDTCEICAEAKQFKKFHAFIFREINLLDLVHTDLET